MQRISGVLIVLAAICSLSSAAVAADIGSQSDSTPAFTLNVSYPASQKKTVNGSSSTQGQSPSTLPRASTVQPAPMSSKEKFNHYLRTTYGPGSMAYTAFTAGISQANGSVNEWGGGMEGYGKRFGSSLGQKAVSRSIWQGLGYLAHEDPRYFRSDGTGIWNRTLHAASQSFISHKDSGGTRFGFTKMAGAFGGGYVSRQWYPDRYHTTSDYLIAGGVSVGWNMARNVFSEFWPDIRKRLHR